MIENIDSKYIQTFEYENSINSDGNILGTCELGTATIQMINDSNTYSSLKGQWIKTIHGSFYIYDVAPVQEKVNIKLSCYDVKYKLDTPYDSSKYTFPMTLKTWRNSIFTECDVTYDNSDFPNSNLVLNEEPYIGDNPSNRQVMSLIAQAGASFVITDKNDKFYFKWFKNTTNNINDWLELTTEKESTNPINVVVLGRGDVEDNVYYPKTLPENKKELRIDNNYILDPQIAGEEDRRNDVIESIYNQVNGFSFIPFTIRTQNVENKLSIDLGDKVSYKDIWGNSLSSYVMTKKITYLGGNPSDDDNYEITLSAEEINETSTEYSYASSIEQRLSKVEVTTDKQNKKITALVKETTTKITSIENSIPKYQTELDIYNITIPVDSELKPLENKDYSVGYTTKFEGSEVESTVSSQSENTGITFGLSNHKITLSVLTSTAITSLSNEFVIDFSYTKDSTTYTDSKKIIVTLALKGNTGVKGDTGANGKDGTNGVNGKDGTDGKNSYLHIKYSNDGATFTSNNGNDVGRYIGSYTDYNETASTNFDDYSWQDTAIVVDEELDDLQNQINNTNKDLNNNYTNNTELDQKLEDQKQTITEEFSTKITQTKSEWQASVIEYINTNGVEKFVNTLVTIDIDGLKLSKSDEDIVSLLNNKGLYVSDGKLREDLSNLLMKVDRAGALFKLLEIIGTIKEQGIIQKEKITDVTFGECQAWYWIGDE